ncbi:hypothetical protein K2173_023683 [Erythroxylum novogranatense]|uniref:Uncharacterized protein n=1 Tax=Erythroxylum novogranatense TaxID=1862640 RepID=A0AAV8TSA2_9ROSI|nr:hypothetical protein K2173_023683 [Erythroxylum novogranatense]
MRRQRSGSRGLSDESEDRNVRFAIGKQRGKERGDREWSLRDVRFLKQKRHCFNSLSNILQAFKSMIQTLRGNMFNLSADGEFDVQCLRVAALNVCLFTGPCISKYSLCYITS